MHSFHPTSINMVYIAEKRKGPCTLQSSSSSNVPKRQKQEPCYLLSRTPHHALTWNLLPLKKLLAQRGGRSCTPLSSTTWPHGPRCLQNNWSHHLPETGGPRFFHSMKSFSNILDRHALHADKREGALHICRAQLATCRHGTHGCQTLVTHPPRKRRIGVLSSSSRRET